MRFLSGALLAVSLFLFSVTAQAARPEPSPVEQGRFSVSLGGGFGHNSYYMAGGLGYFVLDGLLPGFRYQYYRQSEEDYKLSQHNVNVYVRYYLPLSEELFPFLLGDLGWLRLTQWGDGVVPEAGSMFSVLGGGGLAYYVTPGFFVEMLGGLRHYLNPPPWAIDVKRKPTQWEWSFGFGASF